jgi:hypothetical protein
LHCFVSILTELQKREAKNRKGKAKNPLATPVTLTYLAHQ